VKDEAKKLGPDPMRGRGPEAGSRKRIEE